MSDSQPSLPARRAVILAAGMGTRLGGGPESASTRPKPLAELGGRPLILWVLEAVARAGIHQATLVVGWQGHVLVEFAASQPVPGLMIDTVWNDEWRKSNGVSLLKARDAVREPFVLLMSDHVFEDRLLRELLTETPGTDEVILAVDRRIAEVFDLDDATKVRTAAPDAPRRIVAIAKDLAEYDAVDCGLFLCQTAIFDALEAVRRADGDCSLSDGVRHLAGQGRFLAHDIGDAFWQDVDTPAMFAHATENLGRLR